MIFTECLVICKGKHKEEIFQKSVVLENDKVCLEIQPSREHIRVTAERKHRKML